VNIFVLPTRADEVIDSLPDGVVVTAADRRRVRRDGQVRVWWDDTPVDLFFDVHDFHRQVGAAVRVVPFLGQDIPVLACTDLVVFKAMYDRTKDWADIEDRIGAGTVDGDRALGWLGRLLGRSDNSTRRLADILQRMGPGGHP
jgi:hypothetical protein